MAYARWSEHNDIYLYASVYGFVECCGCLLKGPRGGDGGDTALHTAAEVIAHMDRHEAAGHKVPGHLFDPELYEAEAFAPHEKVTD